jgi:thymidylate kinase
MSLIFSSEFSSQAYISKSYDTYASVNDCTVNIVCIFSERKYVMSKQIRGIILEGQSCSGKTSIFNALKSCHLLEAEAERNIIYLAEHYSQTLNWVNGKFENLSQEQNLKVLSDRISMLEQLNNYANSMGEHSRRSRGLFFVFERFHLNYALSHNDITSDDYVEIEQRLIRLNVQVVLCTISPENAEQRLMHRATYTNEVVTQDYITKYIERQQSFVNIANKSAVPTMIINTDNLDWNGYARMILEKIH